MKLEGANLEGANLEGALYDESTTFPKGFDAEKNGMKKASKKSLPAVVNSNLKIQVCEGGEMSPDQKTITCPNGWVCRREDSGSTIMDVLDRSRGKESLVIPMERKDAGKSTIGQ